MMIGLLQVGQVEVGPEMVSMSPETKSNMGSNAGDRSLPIREKNSVVGVWCDVCCVVGLR